MLWGESMGSGLAGVERDGVSPKGLSFVRGALAWREPAQARQVNLCSAVQAAAAERSSRSRSSASSASAGVGSAVRAKALERAPLIEPCCPSSAGPRASSSNWTPPRGSCCRVAKAAPALLMVLLSRDSSLLSRLDTAPAAGEVAMAASPSTSSCCRLSSCLVEPGVMGVVGGGASPALTVPFVGVEALCLFPTRLSWGLVGF